MEREKRARERERERRDNIRYTRIHTHIIFV